MKVHLVKTEASLIKGYTPVLYSQTLNNLLTLSDNECEFILAGEVLDDFPKQEALNIIKSLLSKLRINGTLVIGGTDLRVFCKSVINGLIDENNASEFIKAKQSMSNCKEVTEMLKQLGLKIQSSRITGTHYEITTVRS
jgi:predicted SAM-dependent methyltransferase